MATRLTAMDVEKQEFARKMRGYDVDDVRLYLKSVAEEIERLNLENGKVHEETGQLRREVEEFRSRERMLQQTLLSAQGLAEELKEKARREGELVMQEARLRSDQLLLGARDTLSRLEADIARVRHERDSYETRLRGLIQQHLDMLDLGRESAELNNLRMLPRRTGSE